ncbi:MAG: hypothetical protein ACI9VN_003589 [Patescibacteria group bacterium]|jgi:hypothetical protein
MLYFMENILNVHNGLYDVPVQFTFEMTHFSLFPTTRLTNPTIVPSKISQTNLPLFYLQF